MALLTAMTLQEAQALGSAYGLSVTAFTPLAAGSVNSNFRLETSEKGSCFLRVYEEQAEAGARAELALVQALARHGVPTPAPLERLGGGHVASHRGRPVGVYPWIDGEILCQARVGKSAVYQLGAALARVHAASTALAAAVPEGRFDSASLLRRLDTIEATSDEFRADARAIRARLERYVAQVTELPRGLIHGDLFRDNVLWRGGEIAALIDFESASSGYFAYDVMVCVHAWCYGARFEPELVAALLEGYTTVRPLEARERAALPVQGALAALRFATTRITDFAMRAAPGVPPARDFRRFLARLDALEAGVLAPVLSGERP